MVVEDLIDGIMVDPCIAGGHQRAFIEIQRGDRRRRCERRHRCPKLDGLSSPCLSSPKGSTVPVVSPIPPFATTLPLRLIGKGLKCG